MAHHDNSLGTIIALKHTFPVATLSIRAPIGLLGIVRLEGILSFHLQGDHQVGAWIRIWLTRLSKFYVARHDLSWVKGFPKQKWVCKAEKG